MTDEQQKKSTKVILTREKFYAIPGFRARYIILYVTIFIVWAVATATSFYFEQVEIPIEPRGEAEASAVSEVAGSGETAPAEGEVRLEYRWKSSLGVQIFQAGMIAGMVLFYIYFTRVLALMGYPLPMILGYCAAVFLPIPGILAVAFVDRQVAKTWNIADDTFSGRDSARVKPTNGG